MTVAHTTEPKQPRDGFTIVDPVDQREIDQFCKTYEYADPDTRRMIRVSCELMIAHPRGREHLNKRFPLGESEQEVEIGDQS